MWQETPAVHVKIIILSDLCIFIFSSQVRVAGKGACFSWLLITMLEHHWPLALERGLSPSCLTLSEECLKRPCLTTLEPSVNQPASAAGMTNLSWPNWNFSTFPTLQKNGSRWWKMQDFSTTEVGWWYESFRRGEKTMAVWFNCRNGVVSGVSVWADKNGAENIDKLRSHQLSLLAA